MSELILIPQAVAPEAVAFLEERGYRVKHGSGITPEILKREIQGCHGALVRTAVMSGEVMAAADCLRVIAKHGAGVDNIDVEAASERGIKVTNAPLGMTDAVAEFAVAMMLALAKSLPYTDREFKKTADFSLRYRIPTTGLAGKTISILGMGRIGKAVAKRALAFDMRVVGYDPFVAAGEMPGVEYEQSMDAAISSGDVVTVHIPLGKNTHRLLSAEKIALMKPGAFFINVSRGQLVEEDALIRALRGGRLGGAGLDVFEEEPPPADHPFFTMENVIVSPHNSALTPEAAVRMAVEAAQGIDEVLRGKKLTWPVN